MAYISCKSDIVPLLYALTGKDFKASPSCGAF
uniref:Uncharacterized protein n=1 Tax=Siphoviridae sp. ctpLW14 TaxID=2826464 RepID=A0A8S5NA88_9CAUD|nr:MAG TPA: hypothetical protein [Siphoviridae sp. ctpLW14]